MSRDADIRPLQLWEFLHFWLRYRPLNGNILHVLSQSTQRYLNLVSREFLLRARNCSYERALDQNQRELVENHPVNRDTRPFHFGDSSSLTTLCRDWIRCKARREMTSWREKLLSVSIGYMFKNKTLKKFLCITDHHMLPGNISWRCYLGNVEFQETL